MCPDVMVSPVATIGSVGPVKNSHRESVLDSSLLPSCNLNLSQTALRWVHHVATETSGAPHLQDVQDAIMCVVMALVQRGGNRAVSWQ